MNENKNSISPEMDEKTLREMFQGLLVPPSKVGKEEAWAKLINAIDEKIEKPKRIILKPLITWAIAAGFTVLVLLSSYLFLNQKTTIESPIASTFSIVLPDGSRATLNNGAALSYRRSFGLLNRNVFMKGEIFFQVAKHRGTFRVTDRFNHQVLVPGTEFNVISRSNYFAVHCFEGKVEVRITQRELFKIEKGEAISVKSGTINRQIINSDFQSKPAWVKGEFTFSNNSLSVVFDELSTFYGIQFNADGFDPNSRTFSGTLPVGSYEAAANILSASLGLTFTIAPDSSSITFR